MIIIDLAGESAVGAVLPLCGNACLAAHTADPDAPAGPWRSGRLAVPWCTFCTRCGMALTPRTQCRLCTAEQPCPRWPRTAHAIGFARTATARLAGPVPDALWAAAGELADTVVDGVVLAELLTPRSDRPPALGS